MAPHYEQDDDYDLHDLQRRRVARMLAAWGGAALAGSLLPQLAHAAPWAPERNVEMVVPAGAGGALDQSARGMKQFYDEGGGGPGAKTFLVDNKSGGNGKIAFEQLLQHPKDAHYLSLNTLGYITSYLAGALDVLPHRDFTTIAVLQDEFVVIAVRADSPIKDARALIAALRRDPASQRMGVATSIGNHIHVGAAKAFKAGGVDIAKLVVAPFKSSSDSMVALVGGHLEMVAATTPNVISMMQAGKVRVLAVGSDKRLGGAFAGVPTWRESGVDSVFSSALGVLAPKGVSADQTAYWEDVCRRMVQSDIWKAQVERNQSRANFMPHDKATAYYEEEFQSMKGIMAELGLLKVKS